MRINNFFTKFDVLSNKQFGFRNKGSTIDAIGEILEVLNESKSTDKLSHCPFSDISESFDTVDHNTLMHKCHLYGLRGVPLNFLKSYLSNRNQHVFHSNNCSTTEKLLCGIPQDSVLGALLFLI